MTPLTSRTPLGQIVSMVFAIGLLLGTVAGLSAVAGDGDATITFRNTHEWDICAGVLMVEEAGGTVVDGDGHAMTFNRELPTHRGVIAANASLTGGLQGLWNEAMAEKKQGTGDS